MVWCFAFMQFCNEHLKLIIMKNLLLLFFMALVGNFANGQTVQWASNNPGYLDYQNHTVATDSQGNVYTMMNYGGGLTDFDPGPGVFNMSAYLLTMYIQKFDVNGNFVWAKQVGGPPGATTLLSCRAGALTIDASDNIYFSGQIQSVLGVGYPVDLDMGTGVFTLPIPSVYTAFIEKLDPAGNFVWVKAFVNPTNNSPDKTDVVYCLKTDAQGNIFATGSFSASPDFDPNAGVSILSTTNSRANFILKLNSSGSLVWVKTMECTTSVASASSVAIDLDSNGNIITLGIYSGILDTDPGVGVHTIQAGVYDPSCFCYPGGGVYISKLDANGNYVWGYDMGGQNTLLNGLPSMVIDSNNNILISSYNGRLKDFDFGPGVFTLGNSSFVLKIDNDANFIWAKTLGFNASSNSIALDAAGNVYTAGTFYGPAQDFDPGAGTYILTPSTVNIYISKLDTNGNFVWANKIGNANSSLQNYSLTVAQSGKVILNGSVSSGGFNKSTTVSAGGFLASYTQPTLATNQFELEQNISIYPNPSSGNYNITINEDLIGAKVTLYNLLGQKVKAFSLDVVTTNQNLDTGMYLLEIEKEGVVTTKKLLVN